MKEHFYENTRITLVQTVQKARKIIEFTDFYGKSRNKQEAHTAGP